MPTIENGKLNYRVSAVGDNNADNDFDSTLVAKNRDGSVLERTEWIIDALGGPAIQVRAEKSISGTVEENSLQQFSIAIYDIDSGAVASGDIDITSISNVMMRSRAGGAFSAAGITQPTFAKGTGLVSCDYQFLAAEWQVGDMYKLNVKGITATVGGDTAYIPEMVWSNIVVEMEDLTGKVGVGYDGADDAVEDTSSIRGHLLKAVEIISRTGILYFVGKGGDDANDGKSWTTRRLTVASGYGLCSAGDILIVGPGTFTENINFNTDGMHVIGRGGGVDGTMISGNATMTCRSNRFTDIFFYDTAGTVVKVGADANASYNKFIKCRIGGFGSAIDLHIDASVAGGGSFNIFDKCNFYDATQASVLIDGANDPTGNIFRNCRARPTTGGHGFHVNHASALRNTFLDCVVIGNSSTGTGIYFQAGVANIAANCYVDDITTPYNIAATNHIVSCHEGSLIATNNTIEDDLKDTYDLVVKTVAGKLQPAATTIDLNQAVGAKDLLTGTTQDVIVESLVIRMKDEAAGGALTSISIQTDDTTPIIFISSALGAVANLTAEAQLTSTVPVLIKVGTKIQLTIAGGAHGSAYVCDVVANCRAVVDGGILA